MALLKVVLLGCSLRSVAFLASESVRSLPGILEGPGTHWIVIWPSWFRTRTHMASVSGLWLARAIHRDWLSVHIVMFSFESLCSAIQVVASFVASTSSSYKQV